ncbi:site-specific integrase [Sphingobium sp. BS19]|uniref:site-specific integrase n=1 Tax=Sphingobium sp. BS19 TaxID=3018973 RepID=UPI0022EF8E59|nr:site-specific integrase [Sphingobium sp. BS19]GLJ00170.1 hypothetical protein Sbs19_39870 [Sphingobium sp. BS19]
MTDAKTAVSPLHRRTIDDMGLRNLSSATQRSYIHVIKPFSRFHKRSPDQLGLEDVRAFQVYLVSQGVSWDAPNQTVCALRFFYDVKLDRAEIPEGIAYARTPRKLHRRLPGLCRWQNHNCPAAAGGSHMQYTNTSCVCCFHREQREKLLFCRS